MKTVKYIKSIDFGVLHHYRLKDDAVFYALSTTSLITKELSQIIQVLESLEIKYEVDASYNIKIKTEEE